MLRHKLSCGARETLPRPRAQRLADQVVDLQVTLKSKDYSHIVRQLSDIVDAKNKGQARSPSSQESAQSTEEATEGEEEWTLVLASLGGVG